jgi:hypothetical protein
LKAYPLHLLGIDINQQALDETSRTLRELPHVCVRGDVSAPAEITNSLTALGIPVQKVFHVRSFLDHDRPYTPPRNVYHHVAARRTPGRSLCVDRQGNLVASGDVAQLLVEHLGRWTDVLAEHGMFVLEVHAQDPVALAAHPYITNSVYFEAIHGLSGQQLVEASTFLAAAAAVGLLPTRRGFRKYPATLPMTHTTAAWFRKMPFQVRFAEQRDVSDLMELEFQCWGHQAASAREIRRRIRVESPGTFVAIMGERIVGALYTQRIASVDALCSVPFSEIAEIHDDSGRTAHLITLNVRPDMRGYVGGELLDFVLSYCSTLPGIEQAAGVTRFARYSEHRELSCQEYAAANSPEGGLLDPLLEFHRSRGADVRQVIENYRPADSDSAGAGILVVYDLLRNRRFAASPVAESRLGATEAGDLETLVFDTLELAVGPVNRAACRDRPFPDIGLDSLELIEFTSALAERLQVCLDPNLLIKHATPSALADYLQSSEAVTRNKGAGGTPNVLRPQSGSAWRDDNANGRGFLGIVESEASSG